jgi:Plasmid encoded RepA protein
MGELTRVGAEARKVVSSEISAAADNVTAIQSHRKTKKRHVALAARQRMAPQSKYFIDSAFMQCYFPLRHNKKNPILTWRSKNEKKGVWIFIEGGKIASRSQPGELDQLPVPAGAKIRLIVAYINNYIYKHKTKVVPLGSSFRKGMAQLGVKVTGPNAKALQYELENFFAAKIIIGRWIDGAAVEQRQTLIGKEISLWNERDPMQGLLWQPKLEVTQEYYETVMASSHLAPIHWKALVGLQHNPLAMDIFSYLSISLFSLEFSLTISTTELRKLFGRSYKENTGFWRNFKSSLALALQWYPDAQVELLAHGITLHRSDPLIPRTKSLPKLKRKA